MDLSITIRMHNKKRLIRETIDFPPKHADKRFRIRDVFRDFLFAQPPLFAGFAVKYERDRFFF